MNNPISKPIFPWPTADRLVKGFIELAVLSESGRYLKISMMEEDLEGSNIPSAHKIPRNLNIWIPDEQVERNATDVIRGAKEMYPEVSFDEGIANILSVELFECLDSLPPKAHEIVFADGRFHAIETNDDEKRDF